MDLKLAIIQGVVGLISAFIGAISAIYISGKKLPLDAQATYSTSIEAEANATDILTNAGLKLIDKYSSELEKLQNRVLKLEEENNLLKLVVDVLIVQVLSLGIKPIIDFDALTRLNPEQVKKIRLNIRTIEHQARQNTSLILQKITAGIGEIIKNET